MKSQVISLLSLATSVYSFGIGHGFGFGSRNDDHKVTVVHDFPVGTWIENLAVRSNGQIIATEDSKPKLHLIDPAGHVKPQVLHEFTDTASLLGISEAEKDIFYVSAGNYSSLLLQGYGQANIYRVDMRSYSPRKPQSVKVSKVTEIEGAGALNGVAALPGGRFLLVADFLKGLMWRVDTTNGHYEVAFQNDFTTSTGFGVNGVHYKDGCLYFTNTQKGLLVRVPVDHKGSPKGDFVVVTQGDYTPDDFALDNFGNRYITTFTSEIAQATAGKDGVVLSSQFGRKQGYIAEIAGPTACAFGRTWGEERTLYVTTTGGDNDYLTGEPIKVSGKIVKIRV